ncbi:MAG: DegT/DnrJ/EryC1/StrS family aminotransferase [Candidatus Didemnitutus sp.]|nr:DegT/DnrJ/EryC1/StrS family aminotransferase [Candidatus Didemnitutus sp.]
MSNPRIYLSSPHMGGDEIALVQEAFATNWIAPLGPHVDQFEAEFAERIGNSKLLDKSYSLLGEDAKRQLSVGGSLLLGSSPDSHFPTTNNQSPLTINPAPLHAAALSSGTAALHLAMRWLKLQPGDEVICSSLTFSASVNPVLYERATPVFVDCDDVSWNMNPDLLVEAIEDRIKRGKKPKAVILVHLYGQSADIDPIAATCAKHGIPLIEDAAEALGAVYYGAKQLSDEGSQLFGQGTNNPDQVTNNQNTPRIPIAPGTAGMCGVFSFNGNKIITTSGGGMLTSRDPKLIEKARFWATQSRDPAPHYEHSEVGFNYRMSNVLAAIGRGQLRVLEQRVEARRANCAFYQDAFKDLPGVTFMPEADFGRCTRWLTCLTIDPKVAGLDREKVRLAMLEENIEARPVWKPMHRQPIFKDCAVYGGAVSERLFEHGLCLPSGSNLTTGDLERVVEVVRRVFARGAAS